jgi:hypothetical protein
MDLLQIEVKVTWEIKESVAVAGKKVGKARRESSLLAISSDSQNGCRAFALVNKATGQAIKHGVGYWIGWSAGRSHCRVCYRLLLFKVISFLSSSRQHTQGLPSQGPTLTCHHDYTLFIKATLLKKTPWSPQRSSSIENPTAQHHRKGFFVTRLVSLKRNPLHGRSFKCQLYPHRSSAPSTTPGCLLQ